MPFFFLRRYFGCAKIRSLGVAIGLRPIRTPDAAIGFQPIRGIIMKMVIRYTYKAPYP